MMTDTELNEKIARLMGWKQVGHCWHTAKHRDVQSKLPDYLDPKRLGELMDLADRELESWSLKSMFVHDSEAGDSRLFGVSRIGNRKILAVWLTRSQAIARAIVAHAEHETRSKVVEALKEVTKEPLPPPIHHGHTPWNSQP